MSTRITAVKWSSIPVLLALALSCAGCGDSSPVRPTPASDPPPAAPAPVPPSPAVAFSIEMPLDAGDPANTSGGVNPFGVHIADHGIDGHPGWDLEYRIGAAVRAAADGTVQSIMQDPQRPARFVVQVMHRVGSRTFRTVYFGTDQPLPGVAVGAEIRAGAPIGLAGVLTQRIGQGLVTSAGIHFQLDDFAYSGGLTNQNAVNPETWLTPAGRAIFQDMWAGASYTGELTEPFPGNPRDVEFPVTRRWRLERGDGASAIEFTRANGSTSEYAYRLLDASGRLLEEGTARPSSWIRPLTPIDLLPSTGGIRQGLYDVVSSTLRLVVAAPGAARPASFDGAAVYTTQ